LLLEHASAERKRGLWSSPPKAGAAALRAPLSFCSSAAGPLLSAAHATNALQIDALRRDRAILIEKIKEIQETIERSQALLKRIDEIFAKAGAKPRSSTRQWPAMPATPARTLGCWA
jgi:hypothetical protein